jgi:RNA 2',3'-cyclic 3'-phosphodiesterase
MRAFIAIDLPPPIRDALAQMQAFFLDQLRRGTAREDQLRWTRPEGIHLTLKFLGEIARDQSERVTERLAALEPFESFAVEIAGYGFFPDRRRPQVFWAGVAGPPALAALAGRVDRAMAPLGMTQEKRRFAPHLTLARFKTPRPLPALEDAIRQQGGRCLGRFEVSEFFLFESHLAFGSPAQYRKMARFPEH